MTRSVIWLRDALADLESQFTYLAERNPIAARRMSERIRETAGALGFMALGKPGRVGNTYEKAVVGTPYIISYRLAPTKEGEVVVIIHVFHGAQDRP